MVDNLDAKDYPFLKFIEEDKSKYKTATEAGFPVCSIYDTYSVGNAKEIQRLSNIYVRDFSEIGDYSFSNMKTVLTIAGSDSSGGAGIQADIKTISAHGVYAMSVIVSVVAENTVHVLKKQDIAPEIVRAQVDAIYEDIGTDAVKIGMLPTPEVMSAVAEKLRKYCPKNVVVDPVMYAKDGTALMAPQSIETFKAEILPLADAVSYTHLTLPTT